MSECTCEAFREARESWKAAWEAACEAYRAAWEACPVHGKVE